MALIVRIKIKGQCCAVFLSRVVLVSTSCTLTGFPGHEKSENSLITYGTVCLHVAFVFVCLFVRNAVRVYCPLQPSPPALSWWWRRPGGGGGGGGGGEPRWSHKVCLCYCLPLYPPLHGVYYRSCIWHSYNSLRRLALSLVLTICCWLSCINCVSGPGV